MNAARTTAAAIMAAPIRHTIIPKGFGPFGRRAPERSKRGLDHHHNLTKSPGFLVFVNAACRAVEPQNGEVPFSGHGGEPVLFLAFRGFRPEVKVGAALSVLDRPGTRTERGEGLAKGQPGVRLDFTSRVRRPAAPTYCQRVTEGARRSGKGSRIPHSDPSVSSSTLCPLGLSGRSTGRRFRPY